MSKKSQSKNAVFLIVIAVLMIGAIAIGIAISNRMGKSHSELTHEAAMTQLDKKLKKVSVHEIAQ